MTDFTEDSIQPWYQRWFGAAIPSEKSLSKGWQIASVFAFYATVAVLRLAFGYGVGYGLGYMIDFDAHTAGCISAAALLLLGGGGNTSSK